MKSGHNINMLEGDGYLVIPISMARMETGQTPEKIYKIFDYFAKKLSTFSSDVVLLYTSGLYFNSTNLCLMI